MLDQNTDRMWYLIGVIIISGLILTSSIMLFTDVAFAGVDESMVDLVSLFKFEPNNIYSEDKVIRSGIYGYHMNVEDETMRTIHSKNVRSFYWKVVPGETYHVVRSDMRNSRYGIAFAKDEPKSDGTMLYHVSSRFQNDLEMVFDIPDDMEYAYLYLYDVTSTTDDLPDIGIYRVSDI